MSAVLAVRSTFQACQSNAASHGILCIDLKCVHKNAIEVGAAHEFTAAFVACIDRTMLAGATNQCSLRAFEFIVKYVELLSGPDESADETEEDAQFGLFVDTILERYMPGMRSGNKDVRFLCSKLVGDVSSVALLTDEMQEQIQAAALERIRDAEHRVRVQAIITLARLEISEPVAAAFATVIMHDPSAETRLSAIYNAVGVSSALMETISARVRDESFTVRKALFIKILPKVDIRVLSIRARESIVLAGLSDREEVIRLGAEKLVAVTWVSMCDNNLGKVLQKLDVLGRPEAADMLVQAFFRVRTDIAQVFDVSPDFFDELSAEGCMLLRGFQDYCLAHKAQRLFDEKMPDLATLAQAILDLWAKYTDEEGYDLAAGETVEDVRDYFLFMIEQLMLVCSRYDNSPSVVDPVIREKLTDVVAAVYEVAFAAPEEGTLRLMEHVVAIEHKLNSSSDTALLLWAFEMADASPATQDPDEAHVGRLLHALLLFQAVLRQISSPDVRSSFPGLYESFIAPALASPIPEMRTPGLGCLALACIIDLDFAEVHLDKFIAIILQEDASDGELAVAVNAVADLSTQHSRLRVSVDVLAPPLLRVAEARELPSSARAALLALCRLYVVRRLDDAAILGDLVAMFFETSRSPAAANIDPGDDVALERAELVESQQQTLSAFLQTFALTAYGKRQLAGVFESVFVHFLDAKRGRGRALVSVGDFVNFYLSVLDSNPEFHAEAHAVVALPILRTLQYSLPPTTRKSLLAVLPRLDISALVPREALQSLLDELDELENVEVVAVRRALTDFRERVQSCLPVLSSLPGADDDIEDASNTNTSCVDSDASSEDSDSNSRVGSNPNGPLIAAHSSSPNGSRAALERGVSTPRIHDEDTSLEEQVHDDTADDEDYTRDGELVPSDEEREASVVRAARALRVQSDAMDAPAGCSSPDVYPAQIQPYETPVRRNARAVTSDTSSDMSLDLPAHSSPHAGNPGPNDRPYPNEPAERDPANYDNATAAASAAGDISV